MAGRGGYVGDYAEGLPGLWGTARDGHLALVPGTGHYGGEQQLTGGGGQLRKVSEELGAADEDPGPGGGIPKGIQDVI